MRELKFRAWEKNDNVMNQWELLKKFDLVEMIGNIYENPELLK
jgi:hypothetical protein